jgi:hypothetical protein
MERDFLGCAIARFEPGERHISSFYEHVRVEWNDQCHSEMEELQSRKRPFSLRPFLRRRETDTISRDVKSSLVFC